ncbi:MAG: winged helix-turn-helix domain-containing protein [Pseudomonadota bacterium]
MLESVLMIYRFDDFELDADKVELRKNGEALAIEPQVFALLCLLVDNRERMVSKDEVIEKIWAGRIVSDSAIASRIKSARRALGDSGAEQCFIRTVHGQGFRFVGDVQEETPPPSAQPAEPALNAPGPVSSIIKAENERSVDPSPEAPHPNDRSETAKPSLAVLPFGLIGEAGPYAGIADALPHDLITALARLRWLFVIARGSSFRFRGADPDIAELRRLLRVRYCLTGMVEMFGTRINIVVELADTRDGGAIWGDRFTASLDDIHEIRTRIIASVVAALELQIPLNEARVARLSTPESLDAWSSYHLGLQHLLRFTKEDNAAAAALFTRAVREDPGFSRAHAGLSSTHFQNAFLKYTPDPASDILKAKEAATTATELDPMDPFSNFAMGRTFWLEGDLDGSLGWLDRATAISPNYAQGIYARAWTDTISGRGLEGLTHADTAMSLSPLDPFLYAMLGTRALAYILEGDEAKAAAWAEKAARAPGAHVMIAMIAVVAHSLGGNRDAAASWAENVRARRPDVTSQDFFQSFPFHDDAVRARMARALAEHRL